MILDQLEQLKQQALTDVEAIKNNDQFNEIYERYFSKKSGALAAISKDLKDLAEDIRPKAGALLQTVRQEVQEAFDRKRGDVGGERQTRSDAWIDPTMPHDRYRLGTLHPMTTLMRELEEVFTSMGFMVLDGPEVESDFYNFEGLNVPDWHPAREAQDTFYVESGQEHKHVLRTHTSNVQVRAMQEYGAPLRMVAPGRVYRNEAIDATHDHTFHQIEGLMIDEHISIAHLVATLKEMMSAIYKKDIKIRLRPGYFPFVEPGFELDMYTDEMGWLEMGGSGMVHPNVLRAGGIDPDKYSGFAFGMGMTRMLMLKYGITDIRLIQTSDLRFLKQF